MNHIFIIVILMWSIIYNQTQESIYDRINLAKSYIEAGLEEDAIMVYKNLLSFEKDILGPQNIELINIFSFFATFQKIPPPTRYPSTHRLFLNISKISNNF